MPKSRPGFSCNRQGHKWGTYLLHCSRYSNGNYPWMLHHFPSCCPPEMLHKVIFPFKFIPGVRVEASMFPQLQFSLDWSMTHLANAESSTCSQNAKMIFQVTFPIELDCPLYILSKGLSMVPSLSGQCCYFQLVDQWLKRGIYISSNPLVSDRILWLVFPQHGNNGCVAFPVLAAPWRCQCGVLELAGAAYPVLRSPQRQGCGLGPQEEWAYHQSQWPQQQSEWRKACDSD